jgi:hypothetical protein
MAKRPTPDTTALGVRERMLLFCIASGTDWQRAGVTGEIVTALVVKGLLLRDSVGRLVLTDDGRAVLRALLPDL